MSQELDFNVLFKQGHLRTNRLGYLWPKYQVRYTCYRSICQLRYSYVHTLGYLFARVQGDLGFFFIFNLLSAGDFVSCLSHFYLPGSFSCIFCDPLRTENDVFHEQWITLSCELMKSSSTWNLYWYFWLTGCEISSEPLLPMHQLPGYRDTQIISIVLIQPTRLTGYLFSLLLAITPFYRFGGICCRYTIGRE